MKRIAALALILLSSIGLQAQKSWTLQECIQYALAHNIQIKQQQLSIKAQELNLLQSKASLLPNLNAYGNNSLNYGNSIDRFAGTFTTEKIRTNNFYLQSSVNLFNGFALLNTISQRRADLNASRMDGQKMENDIALNIATAYLQLLFNQELLNNAESQLQIIEMQLSQTQKQFDAGSIAKGNLLDMQAQFANEELQVVNAENQLALAKLNLIQLLELQDTLDIQIVSPDITIDESGATLFNANDIYQIALGRLPQIKAAEYRIQSAHKSLKVARGYMAPSLSLSGSYGTGYSEANKEGINPRFGAIASGITTQGDTVYSPTTLYDGFDTRAFNEQLKDNSNYTISFSLNIPLFNGLQSRTNMQHSKINIQQSQLQLDQSKNLLRKEIQQAHADALAAMKRYMASKKSTTALEEAFKYMQERYNVGMVNSLVYNDARNNLKRSQSEMLQAKHEYALRIKVLEFYMGRDLRFN